MRIVPMFLLTFVLISLSLRAGPSASELRHTDYGSPLPDDYQDTITTFMEGVLKDPYSAHYTFQPIGPVWQKDGLLFGGKIHAGYGVRVFVNARNSYGAYVGDEEYGFILRDGSVIKMFSPAEIRVAHNDWFRRRNAAF